MNIIIATLISLLPLAFARDMSLINYDSPEKPDSSEYGVDAGAKGTTCKCGWCNKLAGRIVGGKEALVNEFPAIAAIYHATFEVVFCGGSIITKKHILTAGHCSFDFEVSDLKVVLGDHDFTKNTETKHVVIDVEAKTEHDAYDNDIYINDIAILTLKSEITFTQEIGPICLPTGSEDLTNQYVKVIGWGKTKDYDDEGSDMLRKVDLLTTDSQNCVNMYAMAKVIKDNVICTFRRRKDSCEGDSGGPLLWLDPETNRYTQVALVSFAANCGSYTHPAVNTKVHAYLPWIKEKISGFEVCTKA